MNIENKENAEFLIDYNGKKIFLPIMVKNKASGCFCILTLDDLHTIVANWNVESQDLFKDFFKEFLKEQNLLTDFENQNISKEIFLDNNDDIKKNWGSFCEEKYYDPDVLSFFENGEWLKILEQNYYIVENNGGEK